MPTREQLSEDAAALSDEELIDRLRGKGLTELATEVTLQELTARGIDVERALGEPLPPSSHGMPPAARKILRRVLRFPFRAALGVEPLWAVVVFGGSLVFVVWRIIVWGLSQFIGPYPIPPYALPTAYAALGIFALTVAWWGVALWRTGDKANAFWKMLARTAAMLCAVTATLGTLGAARVVHEWFGR